MDDNTKKLLTFLGIAAVCLLAGFFGHDVVTKPQAPLIGGSGITLSHFEGAKGVDEALQTSDGKITVTVLRREFPVQTEEYTNSKAKPADIPSAANKFAEDRKKEGFLLVVPQSQPHGEKKGGSVGNFSMYRPASKDGSAIKLDITYKS